MDIRETGLLVPQHPLAGKTATARPGKHRGVKDAAELAWLVVLSPHSITFAVFEAVSPLLKLRVIRPSWSLGRFHGPSDC